MDNGRMPGIILKFGDGFELDRTAYELRRTGRPQKLERIPMEILLLLLDRREQLVTREEIIESVWGKDVFLDSDNSINAAISKIRLALRDNSENPACVQTIKGKGYRFIAAVAEVGIHDLPQSPIIEPEGKIGAVQSHLPPPAKVSTRKRWPFVLAAVVLLGAATLAIVLTLFHRKPALTEKDTVVLGDFANTTADPVFDETLRQGMAVELDQSPFLSLVAEPRIQQTLRLMGQPADARLTPETAFEVCERKASAAVISGSISSLGSQYVLALKARDCRSGKIFDQQQMQVARKEDVLHALTGMASQFRSKAGESLATVKEHAKPLEEATTPSLDALKAYGMGVKVEYASGSSSAIPFLKHAIELDPNFATAYAYLGRLYGDVGEFALSAENATKAYQLRDRASDAERFFIVADYDITVTGNMEKARRTCEAWAVAYPREKGSYGFRGGLIYPALGNYEDGVEVSKEVVLLDPGLPVGYSMLAGNYIALDQSQHAEDALLLAFRHGIENPDFTVLQYDLAFLKGDHPAMEQQLALSRKDPRAEAWVSDREAFALAYDGRLREARKLSERAVELDQQADQKERAAQFEIGNAVWEGLYGERDAASQTATAALGLSNGRDVQYGVAFVRALAGDNGRATSLMNDLEKRFPEDTAVRFSYIPRWAELGTALRRCGDNLFYR